MPVAVNCCVSPLAIVATGGLTDRAVSTAGVTVSDASAAVIPLVGSRAPMLVVPTFRLAARPALPGAFEIDATAGDVALQVTVAVRSCVVESLNVPVARNC